MDKVTDWRSLERFSFGDSPALADRLLDYVLSGVKTATCWPVTEGQQTRVGKRMVVNDGQGRPRAVIETLSLEQRSFEDMPLEFVLAEGEGFETLEDWRADHRAYFERNGGFAPEMMLWRERFRVVEVIGEGAEQ